MNNSSPTAITFVSLISLFVFTLSGCGSSSSDAVVPTAQPEEQTTAPVDNSPGPDTANTEQNTEQPAGPVSQGMIASAPTTPTVPVQSMPENEYFTEQNIDDVVRYATSAVRGDRLMNLIDELDEIENRVMTNDPAFVAQTAGIDGYTRVHLCPGGGQYLAALLSSSFNFDLRQYEFRNCIIDGAEFNNGYIHRTLTNDNQRANFYITSYSFGVDNDNASIAASIGEWLQKEDAQGVIRRVTGTYQEGLEGAYEKINVQDIDLQTIQGETAWVEVYFDLTVLSNSTGEATNEGEVYARRFEFFSIVLDKGSVEALNARNNGPGIRSAIDGNSYFVGFPDANRVPLERPIDQPYAASGVMQVGHSLNGVGVAGRISVKLDNGDPDSFDIVTESQGETITSSNVPWAPNYSFEGLRRRAAERLLYTP